MSLAPDVYGALRALTLRERAASPNHRPHLRAGRPRRHRNPRRRPAAPLGHAATDRHRVVQLREHRHHSRRRRHAQAPARVPLAGILASDATQLDHLAEAWGAGSRSALVEAALRLYLRLV